MRTQRFRLRQVFWLDMNKPDEEALAATIEDLKQRRTFVTTIRDGIRRAEFLEYMQSLQPDKSAAVIRMEQQLARLERLLLQQVSAPGGPRPLTLPPPSSSPASSMVQPSSAPPVQ